MRWGEAPARGREAPTSEACQGSITHLGYKEKGA
jgi:hypothetical protein